MQPRLFLLIFLGFYFLCSEAGAAEWGPWPLNPQNHVVAAGYRHDDGGALIVMCDTETKLIAIALQEPRANWAKGQSIKFMTRTDNGTQLNDDTGEAIDATHVLLKEPSTWHLSAMGEAASTFAVGTGDYGRIFPVANFRKAMEPVLTACGDHW